MKNKIKYITLGLNIILFFFIVDSLFGGRNIREFALKNIFNFSYGPHLYYLLFIPLAITSVSLTASLIRKKEKTPFFTINAIFSVIILGGVILMFLAFVFVLFLWLTGNFG